MSIIQVIQLLPILLLIQQFILFVRKIKANVLACGLWCYCGKELADPTKMKILALFNHTRGEHATGICIDDTIWKDTVVAREFLIKHKELFKFEKYDISNNTILGHCRQATHTYDKSKLEFAHPHEVKKDDVDFLRFVHNGTISNIDDLAKKYEISTIGKSDSIMLAEILTKTWSATWKGETKSVLQEYEGAATVVFYPVNAKNTIYVHKDFKRELYYWQENRETMYISSIKDSLRVLGADDIDVKEFDTDYLYKIVNGKITKRWDLTKKIPYFLPRPKPAVHVSKVTNIRDFNRPKIDKDGFYFQDHSIRNNGHLYSGIMYVTKDGLNAEKKIDTTKNHLYDIHYVIGGIVMKGVNEFNALSRILTRGDEIDMGEFRKILPTTMQKYAMYPVLGKTFANNNDMVVWSDKLHTLKTKSEIYSWTPVLSGCTYTCGRPGLILTTTKTSKPNALDKIEILEDLITNRLLTGNTYKTVEGLYTDFKKAFHMPNYSYDYFLQVLLDFFRISAEIPNSLIIELEKISDSADGSRGGEDEGWRFNFRMTEVLKIYQCQLEATSKYAISEKLDVDVEDVETVDENAIEGSDYWSTQDFKNDALFSDFQSYSDLSDNYVQNFSIKYKQQFQGAIADLFKEIGFIGEHTANEIKNGGYKDADKMLEDLFTAFKKENYLDLINETLETGTSIDSFVKLHGRFLALNQRTSYTAKERVEKKMLQLALAYILDKNKTITAKDLLSKHNISAKELDKICE